MFKVSLYVPTRDNKGNDLPSGSIDYARSNAEVALASVGAGGWTWNLGWGGWQSDTGQIIREPVAVVYSYLEGFSDVMREQIKLWAQETASALNQECVMWVVEEVNAETHFTSAAT